MRRLFLVSLMMTLFSFCMQAQDMSKSSDNMNKSSNMTTVTGCLKYTMHHYVLTDSNGTQHQLTGYANKLKPHVGHEVEITGTEGVHTTGTPTMEGTASTAHQAPDIKVASVKHIADTCKAGQ